MSLGCIVCTGHRYSVIYVLMTICTRTYMVVRSNSRMERQDSCPKTLDPQVLCLELESMVYTG